jgi:hypothetical protein
MRSKVKYKKLSKSWKNSQLQTGMSGVGRIDRVEREDKQLY